MYTRQLLFQKLRVCAIIATILISAPAFGGDPEELPNFLSIKTNQVNARTGPNLRYPVKWIYISAGEPVEVLATFEKWYKVRDFEGEEAWIHQTMLSRKRFVVVKAASQVKLHASTKESSPVLAKLEFGVRAHLDSCTENWCHITIDKSTEGWVLRDFLWGVSLHEGF